MLYVRQKGRRTVSLTKIEHSKPHIVKRFRKANFRNPELTEFSEQREAVIPQSEPQQEEIEVLRSREHAHRVDDELQLVLSDLPSPSAPVPRILSSRSPATLLTPSTPVPSPSLPGAVLRSSEPNKLLASAVVSASSLSSGRRLIALSAEISCDQESFPSSFSRGMKSLLRDSFDQTIDDAQKEIDRKEDGLRALKDACDKALQQLAQKRKKISEIKSTSLTEVIEIKEECGRINPVHIVDTTKLTNSSCGFPVDNPAMSVICVFKGKCKFKDQRSAQVIGNPSQGIEGMTTKCVVCQGYGHNLCFGGENGDKICQTCSESST